MLLECIVCRARRVSSRAGVTLGCTSLAPRRFPVCHACAQQIDSSESRECSVCGSDMLGTLCLCCLLGDTPYGTLRSLLFLSLRRDRA